MVKLHGFVSHEFPYHVYKLRKALYSLTQASRAWFNKLSTYLMQWGFKRSQVDSFMMIYTTFTTILIWFIYVDDIIIIGNGSSLIQENIFKFNSTFALKDLEGLNFFIGIEVTKKHDSFPLYKKNVQELL